MTPRRVLIIAGEASGDLHGSGVVRELRKIAPGAEIFGVGGDQMKREGMELVYHVNELSFMGFVEVVRHLPLIRSVERTLGQLLKFKKPDVVVLIDYPGFNIRFARLAKREGVPVLYYISPQVWAWHKSRIKKMRGIVDKMLVVFPFEVDMYKSEGIDAEFVGHPLLEVLNVKEKDAGLRKKLGIESNKKVLALLPGSRMQEIEAIFPPMLEAGKAIARELDMEVVVGVAPTLKVDYFETRFPVGNVRLVQGSTYNIMKLAHFALVTSGTATLETACIGTPMFVLYKTSWLTYLIGRVLIRVRNIGLVNIVAGEEVVKEFVQHRVRPGLLAREALKLLRDPERMETVRNNLVKVRERLGTPGASARVARHIVSMV